MSWSSKHPFIKPFFKKAKCVAAMQIAFHSQFCLNPNKNVVFDSKTVLNKIKNLRTRSQMLRQLLGHPKSIKTPQNIVVTGIT